MCRNNIRQSCPQEQLEHVHEVEGFVQFAGNRNNLHCHCFEATTSEGIPCGRNNHFHMVEFKTEIENCHCHTFCGRTSPAIQAGNGEHIHLIESVTSCNDGHKHCIKIATKTEEPIKC